jgi:hypothetical protein
VPSKKQRRRRDKERRHDYEYVYVDSSGKEVEVDEPEAAAPKPQRDVARATAKPAARGARGGGRPIRKVGPPTWQKVFRRAAIFAPVMFVVVYLLKPKSLSTLGVVYQTAVLMAFFIPFSYLMDRMMYRTYLRRTGQEPPRAQPRRR